MNDAFWPTVGTIIAAGLAFLGTWLVQRNAKRQTSTDGAQRLIDQMQEERKADREQFALDKAGFEEQLRRAFQRIEAMEAREHALFDYVALLRWELQQRTQGPPPPFPPELAPNVPR